MSQATFQYRAINAAGRSKRGVLKAVDRNEAYRRISSSGLTPVAIDETSRRIRRERKISLKDLAHLTYQFAILMEARIPIAEGLRSIADQESNHTLRLILEDISDQIESGETITESFRPHRAVFGEIYCETIRAAETSGNLSEVLGQLADMLDQQYEMRKNVRSAMIYPTCVIVALVIAVSFLTVFVVPKFASMFATRGVELPLLTKMLVALSDGVRAWWYLIAVGGLGAIIAIRRAWRNETTRHLIDRWLHRVPHLRSMLVGIAVSRFASVLGLSLRSGLGLLDAIEMGGAASGRPLLRVDARRMRDQVNEGGRLADVLLACEYIPGFARRMMIAGEEAGELPRICRIIAKHYNREVAHLAKNVSTVVEPVMIVGLAVIVLIIALAIFLPMWNMAVVIG